MLRQALTYPLRGPETESVYLHGLVLAFATAIPFRLPWPLSAVAVVPVVLLVGYLGRVFLDGAAGGSEPPAFGPVEAAARRGLLMLSLAAVYLLPAAIVALVTVLGAVDADVAPGSLGTGGSLRVLAGSTAVLLIVLGSLFVLPVAAGAALEAGSLRRGLDPCSVIQGATDGAYFMAFWIALVLLAVVFAIASALSTLGGPGAVVAVVIVFHVLVGATHLVGRGYGTDGSLYELL